MKVTFDDKNTRHLQQLAEDLSLLSGKYFSCPEVFKTALDLLTLLVELEKKDGSLIARTADGIERKLNVKKEIS